MHRTGEDDSSISRAAGPASDHRSARTEREQEGHRPGWAPAPQTRGEPCGRAFPSSTAFCVAKIFLARPARSDSRSGRPPHPRAIRQRPLAARAGRGLRLKCGMERDCVIIWSGTRCIRPRHVAELLGVSVHTLRRWRRRRIGPRWLGIGERIIAYPTAELIDWIECAQARRAAADGAN
jgi:predicted DNA-binding transcriptional regulator AlpA